MERRRMLGVIATGAVAGCPATQQMGSPTTRTGSRTFDVPDGTTLAVENRNGSVAVAGHDADAVELDFEIRGQSGAIVESTTVSGTRTDGALTIASSYDDPADEDPPTVTLTIRCPDAVAVERVHTTNGSVEVSGVSGDATVESENGSITARAVDGALSLSTDNGSITAREVGAIAGADSVNGSISIDVPAVASETTVRAENADVDAAIAPDLDAALTATTDNGSIDVEGLDLSSVERSDERLSGELGDGTDELTIATDNSSIALTALDGQSSSQSAKQPSAQLRPR